MNPFCAIDGMHVSECAHVPCEECGSTLGVCGGCWKCDKHHDDYSECADWLVRVEVVVTTYDNEEGERE